MKKLIFLVLLFCTKLIFAQEAQIERCNCPQNSPLGKGTLYFSWGYNKDYFSKSDLHFKDSGEGSYDFTLYNVKAKDRPGFDKLFKTTLAVPQYSYRLGYYFNNKMDLGIEINFDHTKYVMVNDQVLRLKGTIGGKSYNLDTLVTTDFLRFEHTNGANFLMVNILKREQFLVSKNKKHWLSGVLKPGAGIVIPKTDVAIFGKNLDNRFHVAGYILGLEAGLRYDLFKYAFLEFTGKGTFANYTNVLVIGTGKARHHFFTAEVLLTAGFQFPL
jgi:hypothetical protein